MAPLDGPGSSPLSLLRRSIRANTEFIAGAYAINTSVAYRSQLKAFINWCDQRETLHFERSAATSSSAISGNEPKARTSGSAAYRPAKPNSLRVASAAISKAYETAGLADITKAPQVRDALRSHRNATAQAGVRVDQAEALTMEVMAAIRATALQPRRGRGGIMETEAYARRRGRLDIALIALMRDCLLRRSEAAAVRWTHISADIDGTGRLYIGMSKTDQEGEREPFCSSAARLCGTSMR